MVNIRFTLSLLLILNSFGVFGQFLENLRFGGGIGISYYLGTQTDNVPSINTFGKSEINPGLNGQIHYTFNTRHELGLRVMNTELWSFKSDNYLALNSKINEVMLIYQLSLNKNAGIKSYTKFTHNLAFGLGVLYFRSRFFTANPKTEVLTLFSSVGVGSPYASSGLQIPEQRPTIAGMLGYNFGYRLSKHFSFYIENGITLSGSNKITGNLLTKYEIPNNGYYYGSISLFVNFNSPRSAACPRFY